MRLQLHKRLTEQRVQKVYQSFRNNEITVNFPLGG